MVPADGSESTQRIREQLELARQLLDQAREKLDLAWVVLDATMKGLDQVDADREPLEEPTQGE